MWLFLLSILTAFLNKQPSVNDERGKEMPVGSNEAPGRDWGSHSVSQICLNYLDISSRNHVVIVVFVPRVYLSHLENCHSSQFPFLLGVLK